MNRRQFMAMIAAGGVMTAEGIWMPGTKLISIPKIVEPQLYALDPLIAYHHGVPMLIEEVAEHARKEIARITGLTDFHKHALVVRAHG